MHSSKQTVLHDMLVRWMGMKTLVACMLTLLWTPWVGAQWVSVPLSDDAYYFFDRFRVLGMVQSVRGNARPLSRMEMARMIMEVGRSAGQLSPMERDGWRQIRSAFRAELASLKEDISDIPAPKCLLHLRSETASLCIDAIGGVEALQRPRELGDPFLRFVEGGRIRGLLRGSLGFYLDARNALEIHEEISSDPDRFFEGQAGSVTPRGRRAYRDETNAYVVAALPWFQIKIGKDVVAWGPGVRGSLGLSGNAGPMDLIQLMAEYGPVKFTHLTGFLRTDLWDSTASYWVDVDELREIYKKKNLAAHRLDIGIGRWGEIGLYEVVVYGERGLELGYLLPIMFFRSHEHYLGDRDNVAMGADLTLRPIHTLELYGALFVDDVSTERIGEDYWADRLAYMAGGIWVNPLRFKDSLLRFEYTRIDPYTYTHHYPINVYTHYGRILGHELGPNADLVAIELSRRFWIRRLFRSHLEISLSVERTRHGANPPNQNVGGDVFRPHRSGDANTVHFLDGILEKRTTFGCKAIWWPTRAIHIEAGYRYLHDRNIPLKTKGRRAVWGHGFHLIMGYHLF